ncbi:zinc finger protein 277 [Photinus pyralis]|nr:zinc finger protein 277 [Photinus pyralis]
MVKNFQRQGIQLRRNMSHNLQSIDSGSVRFIVFLGYVRSSRTKMFGPLSFKDSSSQAESNEVAPCLLCPITFNLNTNFPSFLKHIFEEHRVVIEDAQHIANVDSYVDYWRARFNQRPIEEIVPAVEISPSNAKYFVLSTLLKDDKELRHKLKLDAMLERQEFERTDTSFKMSCLFCKLAFEGKRCDYLAHLATDHNVRLGNPHNLVYVDELIEHIGRVLDGLQCLYCEKTFPDRNTLKDHMRKKQHKRINPTNRLYDKYYASNYLEDCRSPSLNDLSKLGENSDEEYADWKDVDDTITCLYCGHSDKDINKLCLHMSSKHRFNFYDLTKHLDFYQRVKLVNYIRRQIHRLQCISCELTFESADALEGHMQKTGHCCMPSLKVFDQPEFYFPTFENDSFLHHLESIDD